MRLVLDVENTSKKVNKAIHMDPFEPGNYLVQVGMQNVDDPAQTHIITLEHDERKDVSGNGREVIQQILNETTLLIMHNAKHDLMWLWECGFKYDGEIYDTMLAEYILQRGVKEPLDLESCAERRGLSPKKDILKEYYKKGYNTNEIPLHELREYLDADLTSTRELFLSQERDYQTAEASSLYNCRRVTFSTCKTLTRMYMSGIKVDRSALDEVRQEFEKEKADIETRLMQQVRDLMGDTPINLNSPEQLSQVIFSRKVNEKNDWHGLFDHVNTKEDFELAIKNNSSLIYKTTASQCKDCKGKGYVHKLRKDGSLYSRPNKCKDCDTRGYTLTETKEVAGLKFQPPSVKWVSANGFSTGKDNLDVLISTAKNYNQESAIRFLTDVKRLSAISSYLSSFVGGITSYTKPDGFLHVGLTQHVTSTGRFSGKNPNMQNMPRGNTFPVKKVFVSRWDGGWIMEADFAQLEFRTAAFLAQDEVAMAEIATGFDVHSYTAKVISDAGQPTTRQEAKEHTFAPLFGATGYGRSKAERAYYEEFVNKYEGIANWHKALTKEALRFNKITNVSGRQYAFPDIERLPSGRVTHLTMLKNYPVQGFATGDVVPLVLIELEARLEKLNSCIVNSVHDSIVVDVHPEEKEYVIATIHTLNEDLNRLVEEAYGVIMNVPLLLEAKIGKNWLDTVDV